MNELQFTKFQGLGNDYLVVPVEAVGDLPAASAQARALCERNYGAGADGVAFVARTEAAEADFAARIFNPDGSEAEISGNGTRCAAAYLYYVGWWEAPQVRIATAAGVKVGRLVGRDGGFFEFEFDMGEPALASRAIPMLLDEPLERVVGYPLRLGGERLEVTCLSMGNPHCDLLVTDFEDVNIDELGPLIEHHPAFPNRTNVEFVRVASRGEVEVRYWERGVGRTLSSGTGSAAAAVAAMLNGLCDRRVRVATLGGTLGVEWGEDGRVRLAGSAEVIYEGRWLKGAPSPVKSSPGD